MLDDDYKTKKKVKSAWEVLLISASGIYMVNESQMLDCEGAVKAVTKKNKKTKRI